MHEIEMESKLHPDGSLVVGFNDSRTSTADNSMTERMAPPGIRQRYGYGRSADAQRRRFQAKSGWNRLT